MDMILRSIKNQGPIILSKYLFFKNVPDIYIEPPFFVDFGCNINFGVNFYANFNATFLDCAPITLCQLQRNFP